MSIFDQTKCRRLLFVTFLVGGLGSLAELLLLEHTEDYWQYVPILLIGICTALIIGCEFGANKTLLSVFRYSMVIFVLSGAIGVWLHYQGNVEFEKEMYPSMEGAELFKEAMMGATPVLAPGTMVALGLVGWIYVYVSKY